LQSNRTAADFSNISMKSAPQLLSGPAKADRCVADTDKIEMRRFNGKYSGASGKHLYPNTGVPSINSRSEMRLRNSVSALLLPAG